MRGIGGFIGICMVFFCIILIAMFTLGISSKIEKPEAGTTEHEVYTNLTSIIQILFSGVYAILLILLMAIVVGAFLFLGRGRRRGW